VEALSKYDPLRDLLNAGRGRRTFTFDELADRVGGLPNSAYQHVAWWANDTGDRHVQAVAWMAAGYLVREVDLKQRTVTFGPSRG
jgi:hypothetical protein